MEAYNANGKRISLLNDSSDCVATTFKAAHPPLLAPHSRTSSASTTPSLSPRQTPSLVRSSSSDSRAFSQTPSPLTPNYTTFDHGLRAYPAKAQQQQQQQQQHQAPNYYVVQHHHHHHAHPAYGKMEDQPPSMYPPLPDATGVMPSAYPMPPLPAQAPPQPLPQISNPQALYRASTSPSSEPSRVSTVSAQSSNKTAQPKKNQYPCPMAKQVGCNDFFTTSGHAARHAKKHTGKKDAFCPECNKAFTRKDNMEQHRRTHQNGRGTARSSNDDSKVKKPTKQPAKKTVAKAEPQLEAAVEQQLAEQAQTVQQVAQAAQAQQQQAVTQQAVEQALLLPASGPYYLNTVDPGPIPALPMVMPDLTTRPPLHRSSFANSLDYIPPAAPMIDPDTLHYTYPSPGLSNGLNSLALAASEHCRMSERSNSARSPSSEGSLPEPSS